MVSIPRYNAPRVDLAPLQGGFLQVTPRDTVTPIANAIGGAAQAIGQDVFREQERLKAEQKRAKEEALDQRFREATLAISEQDSALLTGARQRQGEEWLKPLPDGTTYEQGLGEQRQAFLDKTISDLPDEIKDRVKLFAGQSKIHIDSQLSDHTARQFEARDKVLARSSVEALERFALANPNDMDGMGTRLAIAQDSLRAAMRGMPKEVVDQSIAELTGDTYAARVNGLLAAGKPEAALQVLNDNSKALQASKQYLRLRDKATEASEAEKELAVFQEIRDSGKPLTEQMKAAEVKLANNPKALQSVKADLQHWATVQKAAAVARQQDLSGTIQEMYRPTLEGGKPMSMAQIKRTPAWTEASPKLRQELMDDYERLAKRGDKDDAFTKIAQYANFLAVDDDPKKLAQMSDMQIAAMKKDIGATLVMKLMEAKRSAVKGLDKLENVSLGNTDWKSVAAEAGLKTSGTMSTTQAAKLGKFKDMLQDEVRLSQRRAGKELNQEEKEEIARKLGRKVVLQDNAFWFDQEKPLFEVDAADVAKYFTQNEKDQAVNLLVKAGTAATPQNMALMVERIRKAAKK